MAVASDRSKPKPLPFVVDAALLRELGERLVGKAHIALAELIKNSYDADATVVDVVFGRDSILVRDNGHGMSYDEFESLWMRIGSPHKERQERSRTLDRPLTGSKGVGRLAAQFLASDIELTSISEQDADEEVHATIDWDDAISRGELTKATATVLTRDATITLPLRGASGTVVLMRNLKQEWGENELEDLARELWPLQPPFDTLAAAPADKARPNSPSGPGESQLEAVGEQDVHDAVDHDPVLRGLVAALDAEDMGRLEDEGDEKDTGFRVRLRTTDTEAGQRFERQMRAVLSLWSARIVGTLRAADRTGRVPGLLDISVQFAEEEQPRRYEHKVDSQRLHALSFEIRVFSLQNRQKYGIRVDDAREYLSENGGVHVYDAGFHLPYYGADTDWLSIERDHAHRLTLSELLPKDMKVNRGLNALPTNTRLYGAVRIDTSRERRRTQPALRVKDALTIQVSRDRLVDNGGYRDLRELVRVAVDFYALEETKRTQRLKDSHGTPSTPVKARRVGEVLESHRAEIPEHVYNDIQMEIDDVLESVQSDAERQASQASLLGALATAGISALAFDHELNRHLLALERLTRALRRPEVRASPERLEELIAQLDETVRDARAGRRLFGFLTDEDQREAERPLRARSVLDAVVDQLRPFLRGVKIDHSQVPDDFRLPPARMADWGALFQNVYSNAVNAMLDQDDRRIVASAHAERGRRRLTVQDTGVGVDLMTADALFDPFERRVTISPERQGLGLGGTGLGLTIVRMIASNAGCSADFAEPTDYFATAFQLTWSPRRG